MKVRNFRKINFCEKKVGTILQRMDFSAKNGRNSSMPFFSIYAKLTRYHFKKKLFPKKRYRMRSHLVWKCANSKVQSLAILLSHPFVHDWRAFLRYHYTTCMCVLWMCGRFSKISPQMRRCEIPSFVVKCLIIGWN